MLFSVSCCRRILYPISDHGTIGASLRGIEMRYTKTALLTFGAGLVLALVVVAAEIDGLQRVASALMALGIVAIPVGMAIDWRLATKAQRRPARRRGKTRARRASPAARRRTRKPARPNR